ncbi:MAG: nucleoid-associated protein, partial [Segetibacter sp.]|nr:nucleoid-associated protein [Segetibacter sp.]
YIHGRNDLIEKGYDELTGKHYYKLYYDEEA